MCAALSPLPFPFDVSLITFCSVWHRLQWYPQSPQHQWDVLADADEHSVDLSLVLPHYRVRNQPTGLRMSMFVHSRGEIKSMVVSADDEPYIVTTKSSIQCCQSFRTVLPLCAFVHHRSCNALSPIRLLWGVCLLVFSAQCLVICGIFKPRCSMSSLCAHP